MNEVFEVMQFGAGGNAGNGNGSGAGEWEQERGGRGWGGGRGAPAGGLPARGRGGRPGRGGSWPHHRYPVTGGGPWWGYPLAYPEPYPEPYPALYPAPYAEPPAQAWQEPDSDDGKAGELPPAFKAAAQRLGLPHYQSFGTLDAAIRTMRTAPFAGLYLIVFRGRNGVTRAYHGQTDNVRRRLLQHKLCAAMFDIDTGEHRVYAAATPTGVDATRRRALERSLHDILLRDSQGRLSPGPGLLLTNQRLELEQELLGEAWR